MIEEPPVLTIKSRSNRPEAWQLDRLRGVPSGFVADAMSGRGALSHRIKPLAAPRLAEQVCGVALTCYAGPSDVLAVLAAITEIESGDVLCVSTDQCSSSAVVGDRVMGMLKNAGAVGLVTDGLVRDLDGIRAVGLSVFCAGVSPNSPCASGPGEVGMAINLSGVPVHSGDIIIGDEDGVVVVPFSRVDEVIVAVERIAELELDLDRQVAEGLCAPEHIVELVNSDRVRRL